MMMIMMMMLVLLRTASLHEAMTQNFATFAAAAVVVDVGFPLDIARMLEVSV